MPKPTDQQSAKLTLLLDRKDFDGHELTTQSGVVPNMSGQFNHTGGPVLVNFATDVALGGPFDHFCTFEIYLDGQYTGLGNRAEVPLGGSASSIIPYAFSYALPLAQGTHTVEVRYSKYVGSAWINNGGRVTALSVLA